MHEKLYDTYPEFQEAGMAVEDRIKLRWAPYKRKLIKETRAETKDEIIGLFKQGYTVEEVERMFAQEQEEDTDTSADISNHEGRGQAAM